MITVARCSLLLCALASASCSSCGETRGQAEAVSPPTGPRPSWLARACVPSPARLWDETSRALELPYSVEQVASRLIGLPQDQLEGEVDWTRPMTLVLYGGVDEEPADLSLDDMVVVVGRPTDAPDPLGGVEERRLTTSRGVLHLRADARTIALSARETHLAWGAVEASESCSASETEGPRLTVEIAPELMESREVVAWVARQGAWLEASARQAAARRGPSTLGDPEALARMLARRLEEIRQGSQAAAPLRAELTTTAAGALIELAGSRSPLSETSDDEPPRPPPLAFFPPDSYLVFASWSDGPERRDRAREMVDGLARVARDRLGDDERQRLTQLWPRLAAASRGWTAIALRPALEPGPAIVLAVVETEDRRALTEALVESVDACGQGYLASAFEHLGAQVELAERSGGPEAGAIRLRIAPPEGSEGERGSVVRTLTGESPTLAWRAAGGDRVIIAFGPSPERELNRMEEASGGELASILTQPLLSGAFEAHRRAAFVGYGWTPGVGALLTRGAPPAQGLPEGGVALATGMIQDRRWRAAIHLGPSQLRALLELLTEEDQR